MTVSEYLKKYNITIDEKLYIKYLKDNKDILLKMREQKYRCATYCNECPLSYMNDCLSCKIARIISISSDTSFETNMREPKYFKIKSELVEFLIKKAYTKIVQEELDI